MKGASGGGAGAAAALGAADTPVPFSDVRAVFESSCWKCHGAAIQLSKLDLRTREAALKGGPATEAAFRAAAEAELAPSRGLRDNAFKIELTKRVITDTMLKLAAGRRAV